MNITFEAGRILLTAASLILLNTAASAADTLQLRIGEHTLTAEIADTSAARSLGLMGRRSLPEDRGMLFVWPDRSVRHIWMKNTYIPLSVAFIDGDGTILNIEDMAPETLDVHRSAAPARYALEVNRGWFEQRRLHPGMGVDGLPQ